VLEGFSRSLTPLVCMCGRDQYNLISSSVTDSGIECTLSELADGTKLSGAVDSLGGRDAIQKDLDSLQVWAHVNLKKFNKDKCKVLYLSWFSPWYQYKLGYEWIEKRPVDKYLGLMVDDKSDMSWQCVCNRWPCWTCQCKMKDMFRLRHQEPKS